MAFLMALCLPVVAVSQKQNQRNLEWQKSVTEFVPGKGNLKFLQVSGLTNNPENGFLPELLISEPIGSTVSKVAVEVVSEQWEDLPTEDAVNFVGFDQVPNTFKPIANISIEKKKHFAIARIIPLQKVNGKVKRLRSIAIRFVAKEFKQKSGFMPTYASSSVLASGNWYKISVKEDGIYKITPTLLQQIGIDPASVDPRNIRIYGNGGGMLPFANSSFRHDDLQENAIYVSGENDGSFGQNDFILFYGQGSVRWKQNTSNASCVGNFYHANHDFSDETYYFITVDKGPGKRIGNQSSVDAPATHQVTSFNDYAYHEKDEVNLIKSGKDWYGEVFDITTQYEFSFSFPNLDNSTPVHLRSRLIAASISNSSTSFSISANNSVVQTLPMPSISGNYTDFAAKWDTICSTFSPNSENLNLRVFYSKGSNPEAKGWLDFLEINARRNLIQAGSQMGFRDINSVGAGNVAEFTLTYGAGYTIWDVTDPINIRNIAYSTNGNSAIFKANADFLHEYISFDQTSFLTPSSVGPVANQNLHGTNQVEMVILTHPDWISQAERLADYHRNSKENPLTVQVVTPQQVYNEFSSGASDISAIRDYMRMYYNRSTSPADQIKYLLLFGDGSYDNKNRLPNNTAFIPTYESSESLNPATSYVCDDYYALLDSNEGNFYVGVDVMDIGVGRLPVSSIEQATNAVNKIIGYTETATNIDNSNSCCSGGASTSVLAPDWRNIVSFVADDEDGNLHMSQSNELSNLVDTLYPWLNIDKIYLDAYQQVTTPGGQRYPEVNKAINDRCQKGALLINYTGHGGEIGLAHERVWMVEDINSLTNINSLPAFVTATCEFSRWDDPGRTSAGEWVFLNPNGGGIALFTTTRLVYSAPNKELNKNFLKAVFDTINGKLPAMGEVMRYAKSPNLTGGIIVNSRNFSLLGDPAQRLAYPEDLVKLAKINNVAIDPLPDTIQALSLVTLSGQVTDRQGNVLNDYSGTLYPTIFDKPSTILTQANDGGSPFQFKLQKNILYKGKATVENGYWQFQFVVPKDIAYNYGLGRMSFYVNNASTDGTGYFENFIIGGSNPNAPSDVTGPIINLYLNDDKFVFGGVTNENPLLLAYVTDSNGVNTVGNGIGHDITAILDQNTSNQLVLNDYYQADLNSYKSGSVRYNFADLGEGRHTLNFKIWDVYNNSSDAYTEFVVAKNADVALKHVLNYPNPFTTKTSFMFEHNQTCSNLDVHIQIMTISGKVVRDIQQTIATQGFRIDQDQITWDGKDDYGSSIGKGVYIYRINVRNPDGGSSASQFERLVILN
jgi:hypothetical protein